MAGRAWAYYALVSSELKEVVDAVILSAGQTVSLIRAKALVAEVVTSLACVA